MQLNFFKTKKSFKKKRLGIYPDFYWKLVITLLFLLTAASFAFGYYVFTKVEDETDSSPTSSNSKQLVEKDKLKQILLDFSAKEKKSNDIISNPTIVVDPSL